MVPILRSVVVVFLPLTFAGAFIPPSAAQEKTPRLDFNGVPLPDGALARHGTVRMWHHSRINQLAFTPDGKGLLSSDNELAFYKWDLTTGKELWQFDRKHLPMPLTVRNQSHEGARRGLDGEFIVLKTFGETKVRFMASHSGDGKVLAVADPKANAIIALNTTTGKQICKVPLKWDALVLTVSPSGKLLAILETTPRHDEAALRIWDLVKGKEMPAPKLSRPSHYIDSLVFSADEKQLAGICQQSVAVWDLTTNKRMANYEHDNGVYDVAFSQDGRWLASASTDGSVRVWDKTSEEEIKKLALVNTHFTTVAFTPDSKQVVAGDGMGNLHLWNLTTGFDKILKGHRTGIAALSVSPNGASIASADQSGGLRMWDAITGEAKQIVKETERLKGIGVKDGGHSLVLWTAAGPIRHVDALTGGDLLEAQGPPKESGRVNLTADGQIAAWFDLKNKSIALWDAATGAELRQLPIGLNVATRILTFSRDGQFLVTMESGRNVEFGGGQIQFNGNAGFQQIGGQSENIGTVRVWSTTTGKQIRSFAKISPDTAVFSPDGKLLALLTEMDELCLFEMASGKERCRLRTLCYNADAALAFSPNGRHLVTTADNAVCLWDLTKSKPVRGFYGHDGMVLAVAFGPKGDIVASAGRDGTVRLWKVDTGEELRCFSGHQGGIERLTFSDDGKTLISVGADQNILVWDATSRAAAVKPAKADGKILERCWSDLGHDDPAIAFRAMGDMIDLPAEAVSLLGKKLTPAPAIDAALIDKLIAELDSETFAVREKAMKALEKLEGQARQALENVLEKPPSAEMQARAKKLLEGLDAPLIAPEELRIVRAVEVLERIGTAEARALLARLAKGAPGARLTVEAAATSARLTN